MSMSHCEAQQHSLALCFVTTAHSLRLRHRLRDSYSDTSHLACSFGVAWTDTDRPRDRLHPPFPHAKVRRFALRGRHPERRCGARREWAPASGIWGNTMRTHVRRAYWIVGGGGDAALGSRINCVCVWSKYVVRFEMWI